MVKNCEKFIKYLAEKDIKCTVINDEESVIRMGFGLENCRLDVFVYYDDGGHLVQINVCDYMRVPNQRLEIVLDVINHINRKYRWAKFLVDDNDIEIRCDGILTDETSNETTYELLAHVISIADDVFPELGRMMWDD